MKVAASTPNRSLYIQDLGSILTFLRICRPLDNEDFFKRMVLRPLKDGDPSGAELLRVRAEFLFDPLALTFLQALMSHICIRRTKEVSRFIVPGE